MIMMITIMIIIMIVITGVMIIIPTMKAFFMITDNKLLILKCVPFFLLMFSCFYLGTACCQPSSSSGVLLSLQAL